MGETREERLREFLEENDTPVVALREGTWLRVEGEHASLEGTSGPASSGAGAEPEEVASGAALDDLLKVG
jgi:dipeptidase E